MCGIGAILRTDGKPIPQRWVDFVDGRIAHRGPDGKGRFRDRVEIAGPGGPRRVEVSLVHRRLAIIDPGAVQPLVSEAGRDAGEGLVAVVFNGCIYNHRELRAELESAGHRFLTDHSDTEVLVHGHRQWGEKLQERLLGMYAYALWDRGRASLTLARDWFGEKPHYHRIDADSGGGPRGARGAAGGGEGVRLLVAASDAGAVAGIPTEGVAPAAPAERRAWVRRYLQVGYAWDGRTLGPGGVEVAAVEPSAPFHRDELWPALRDDAPTDDEVETLIDQAVARRLEADVPLGCFLSGGVDSSMIACFARRHRRELATYSVRMPGPRYDETPFAEAVAAHLGTRHHTLQVAPRPAEDLVRLIEILGQPFGDSSILPTHWVSRAAREHVSVALSGDGGDELFAGYERYLAVRVLAAHPRLLGRIPAWVGGSADPRTRRHKLGRLGEMARELPLVGVLATESIFTQAQIRELLEEGPESPVVEPVRVDAGDDALVALRRADLRQYLPGDLLTKVDTASMAVALEVRCPYLDRALAEAMLATPVDRLLAGGRKGILRRIARRHLPASIVDRPKMGFAVPIGQWFRTDFGGMRALLLDHLGSTEPFGSIHMERSVVRRFVDEHLEGRRDHSLRLFALLTLSIWSRSRRA